LRSARPLLVGARRDAHTGLDVTDGSLLAATWSRRDDAWVAEDLIVVPAAGFSPVFQTLGVSCVHPVTGEPYPDGAIACLDTPSGPVYHVCNNGTWQSLGEPCEFIAWA
jgi:hypothetical protein